jgi:anti-sigma regulatory factor (Ser/Thr protein kinase)
MDVITGGNPTVVLLIEEASQVGHARRMAQQLAAPHGFDEEDGGRLALVVTELATNILKHAGRGELHLRTVAGSGATGIEVAAVDRGPGFSLVDGMRDGFSTTGTKGNGLGAVVRLSQVFDAYADHRGAVLVARLYPRRADTHDIRFGVSQHALHDDPACGDTWRLALRDGVVAAVVVDGLGHGPDAARAADAGADAFALRPFAGPAEAIGDMHMAMSGSRGGAVGVAQFDGQSCLLTFAGVGNIAAALVSPTASRGMASHPGIVGGQFRKAGHFDYPDAGGQLLVMHSDGLQSRWRLTDYPGLWHRHPAVIATLLHRDFSRGKDDVTVLVIALEATHG